MFIVASACFLVTAVDQQPIDARKPSPVSTGPLEAKGIVPDSILPFTIFVASKLLYFWFCHEQLK
jgi:hypothetical protein